MIGFLIGTVIGLISTQSIPTSIDITEYTYINGECYKWKSKVSKQGLIPYIETIPTECPDMFTGHMPEDRGRLKGWIKNH